MLGKYRVEWLEARVESILKDDNRATWLRNEGEKAYILTATY